MDASAPERQRGEAAAPWMRPLAELRRAELEGMLRAGDEVLECLRVLGKCGANVVGEVLRGQGTFYEWDHYPEGDVYDHETHSQYYYHAHRGSAREHGHFHTFLRRPGMPDGVRPVTGFGSGGPPAAEDALCHLIALSMDAYGTPIRLFAVNRWVTGETWYPAADVVRMLDRFMIDHASPSWPVNRWLTGMLRLFKPQIVALVQHRDQVVLARADRLPGTDVFEDRDLEVTGFLDICIDRQIAAVRSALAGRSALG